MQIETISFDRLDRFFPRAFRGLCAGEPAASAALGVVPGWGAAEARARTDAALSVRRDLRALRDVLVEYHRSLDAPPESHDNAARLGEDGTACVVGGQQPGLFGGPLYTFYKAMTAIDVARRLGDMVPGVRFVPVFLNHSDDHDLTEMDWAACIDREGKLRKVRLPLGPAGAPAWAASPTAPAAEAFEAFRACLRETEFSAAVLEAFRPGEGTFAAWTSRALSRVFGRHGLVVVEPRLLRAAAAPVVERVATDAGLHRDALAEGARALEGAGLDAPLDPEATTALFVEADGLRRKRDGGPAPDPLALSPGVALRPVVQDFVLPVAAAVTGPAEASYLAQLGPLYAALGVPRPILVPRWSATLMEQRVWKALDRFGLTAEAALTAPERAERALSRLTPAGTAEAFRLPRRALIAGLRDARAAMNGIDPALLRMYKKYAGRIVDSFRELKRRAAAAARERHGVGRSQFERMKAELLPEGKPQERVFGPLPWLNRRGPGFLDTLFPAMEGPPGHRVVRL